MPCCAEVNDDQICEVGARQHEVFWLDVCVDYVVDAEIAEACHELLAKELGCLEGQSLVVSTAQVHSQAGREQGKHQTWVPEVDEGIEETHCQHGTSLK